MRWTYNRRFYLLTILLIVFIFVRNANGQVPQRPVNYVSDLAGIVNNDIETRLNTLLRDLEQKTTTQLFVLTINTLDGSSIEDLSIDIAHNKWRIGQKGKDNGLLLLVAHRDQKYRFEVGYGLEGILPDSLVGSIGRQYLVPYFRKGDYSRGIYEGVVALIQPIAQHYNVQITGAPPSQYRVPGNEEPPTILRSVLSVVFFIILVILFIRHPRLLLFLFLMSSMGGRGGTSWGGSGGGFGGGRGGGFGGGGASGGW